jgi:K+-sensing histidine kinase KdpD
MNLAFRAYFTRNLASAAMSSLLVRNFHQAGLVVAAPLRRGWTTILRLATDAPEPHPPWYWPDYLRAVAVSGLLTAIAFPLSSYFGLVNIVMLYLLGTTVGALGSLRRKLEVDPGRPQHILTELGVGYRLVVDAEPPAGN